MSHTFSLMYVNLNLVKAKGVKQKNQTIIIFPFDLLPAVFLYSWQVFETMGIFTILLLTLIKFYQATSHFHFITLHNWFLLLYHHCKLACDTLTCTGHFVAGVDRRRRWAEGLRRRRRVYMAVVVWAVRSWVHHVTITMGTARDNAPLVRGQGSAVPTRTGSRSTLGIQKVRTIATAKHATRWSPVESRVNVTQVTAVRSCCCSGRRCSCVGKCPVLTLTCISESTGKRLASVHGGESTLSMSRETLVERWVRGTQVLWVVMQRRCVDSIQTLLHHFSEYLCRSETVSSCRSWQPAGIPVPFLNTLRLLKAQPKCDL